MQSPVTDPAAINPAFADAFNSRELARLLALYEPDAALHAHHAPRPTHGRAELEAALAALLQVPGRMQSRNAFCIVHGDIALLRADWRIEDDAGALLAEGSSAEVARRQADGGWRYVIDTALGTSLARDPGISVNRP